MSRSIAEAAVSLGAINWASAIALVLIIVAAAPLVLLLGIVFRILSACVSERLRSSIPPCTVQTAFGQFIEESGYWRCATVVGKREIAVTASSVDGIPNPDFLSRVPRILSDLASLETVARRRASELSARHQLDELADDHSAEFALGFSDPGDPSVPKVYVCFDRDSVVDINFVD